MFDYDKALEMGRQAARLQDEVAGWYESVMRARDEAILGVPGVSSETLVLQVRYCEAMWRAADEAFNKVNQELMSYMGLV